jgi:hypothetical protein
LKYGHGWRWKNIAWAGLDLGYWTWINCPWVVMRHLRHAPLVDTHDANTAAGNRVVYLLVMGARWSGRIELRRINAAMAQVEADTAGGHVR